MVLRRRPRLSTAALVALFAATACGSSGSTVQPPTTTTTSSGSTSTTGCTDAGNGMRMCVIEGRPLRRRRRRRLLLPSGDGDRQARTEYASVASFGELALRLIAVGAPVALVERCHRAALEEIGHARSADALAGRGASRFGAVPELLGRRIGGRRRSRRVQLQRIAVESFTDGWLNEGAAAAELRRRAEAASSDEERAVLAAMADDEQGHAELARDIVTWCFDEDPAAVGRALASGLGGRVGVEGALELEHMVLH